MKASILFTLTAAGILVATPWSVTLAQRPDSTARQELERETRRELRLQTQMRSVAFETPTLFVVAPLDSPDTSAAQATGCSVAAATGMRCVHLLPGVEIVDRRYSAVSVVPRDLAVGYVLAAPGIRPSLVREAVPRAALEDSARAFLMAYRALPRGRQRRPAAPSN